VLMATGLIDKKPQTEGLADGIVHGAIRFCPICDGYEASDKRIGVLGPFETAAHKALFMRTYSRDVRLFSTDRVEAPELSGELAAAGIDVAGIAARVDPSAEGVSVTVEGGKTHVLDVLYPALGCIVRSELAAAIGAKCSRVGTLNVDDRQSTTIDGLFGAGDVVADLHQLSVATDGDSQQAGAKRAVAGGCVNRAAQRLTLSWRHPAIQWTDDCSPLTQGGMHALDCPACPPRFAR